MYYSLYPPPYLIVRLFYLKKENKGAAVQEDGQTMKELMNARLLSPSVRLYVVPWRNVLLVLVVVVDREKDIVNGLLLE